MKKFTAITGIVLIAAIAFTAFKTMTEVKEIAIGAKAPMADVKMKDVVSETDKNFNDIKKDKGLVVIFSCNTCPFVKKAEQLMVEMNLMAEGANVGYVFVNSNEAQRANEDSPDAMKKEAADMKYTFPYLIDNNSAVADAFGAMRTPQAFVFDKDGKLVYKGAIMDDADEAKAKNFYVRDAIKALRAGKAPAVKEAKSIGCTIKRKQAEAK